jgi:hypothetical protein
MTRRDLLKGLFATAVYTAVSPVLPSTNGGRYLARSSLAWTDLINTTLMKYRPILADNITRQNAFWLYLKKEGYVNELST